MVQLNIDKYIDIVDADFPSGENLEYDPVFLQMLQESEGTQERQIGDSVIPAREPNWNLVRDLALQLFERTRDVRVCVCLIRALCHTDGFEGVEQGLLLINKLLERQWNTLHPIADPEDDYPISRLNALNSLIDFNFLTSIRHIAIVATRGLGQFSLRDIEIAMGKVKPFDSDIDLPDMSVIDATFMECDLEPLKLTTRSILKAVEYTNAIEALVTEKVGITNAINLQDLIGVLEETSSVLKEKLAMRGEDSLDAGADTNTQQEGEHGAAEADEETLQIPNNRNMGRINTSGEVIQALDQIIDYYAHHEPSSPIPLLLERAKRLVSKDFIEILQDLAPDSVQQVTNIAGLKDD